MATLTSISQVGGSDKAIDINGIKYLESFEAFIAKDKEDKDILNIVAANRAKSFSGNLSDITINGQTYSDPDAAIKALEFIGNFKKGGSSPSSTQWGDITGDIANQTDLQEILDSKADLSDIPAPTTPGVFDVSKMFNIATNADISVFMFRRETEVDKPLIKIHGFDNSGESNDLIIEPSLGFGSNYDSFQAIRDTADGTTFTDFAVKLEKETTTSNGKITIPNGLRTFDMNYHCHKGENKASYFVDTNNVIRPFDAENTPLSNFCVSGSQTSTITINGESFVKNTIREIVFGSSYKDVMSIGTNFLTNFSSLISIDLSGLSGTNAIENGFISNCSGLTSIDLSPLGNVTTIGAGFLTNCSGLTSIDLSPLGNVTAVGTGFLINCSGLTSIDLSPLGNVTFISDSFLSGCSGLTSIDLSPLGNVTSISPRFISNCSSLTSIDLSPLSNVASINSNFLAGCLNLISIQIGNVDWSNKSVSTSALVNNVPNIDTSILYADTQELADAFKVKMNGKIDNWTVIINE